MIGEKLDLSSNTLTPLLKRMDQHGLVKRIRSKEDERVLLITITKLGKTTREEAYDLPNILLDRSTLSFFRMERTKPLT
ncbi:MarR family transcriptional regulator [Enterococcus sp. DIV0660C]|uniref:transcriptional regulator, SarA/Rot family n=1 Tax=Enterococcus sp. DIV0660C TaxID=2230880 RepID=UPI001F5D166E|nr:MarR family transcriptional regulator [Enterococcus sp. DIV0660C]